MVMLVLVTEAHGHQHRQHRQHKPCPCARRTRIDVLTFTLPSSVPPPLPHGSVALQQENWGLLRHGIVVYVDMPVEDIYEVLPAPRPSPHSLLNTRQRRLAAVDDARPSAQSPFPPFPPSPPPPLAWPRGPLQ